MALYSITTRVTGEQITATKYNADHQNHADNNVLTSVDDYSSTVGQMQSQVDGGESGTESQPTTAAGEIERLRFAIAEAKGTTYWYETATTSINALAGGTGTSMIQNQLDEVQWGII